jgi:hypothetical protein
LYNLKTDRAETTDVARDHQDVISKMESVLKTARTVSPHWPIKKEPTTKKQQNNAAL